AYEPWNRPALLGLADLDYRRGLYRSGLSRVNRVLQLDAYDADANFAAGNLYWALGRVTDAREAYGWAARSMMYRSVAYVRLAEIMLAEKNYAESTRYAWLALDYDRANIPARQVLAIVGRKGGDAQLASTMRDQLLEIDPLHHFVTAERYLATGSTALADSLTRGLKSEYPDQAIMELAIDYVRRGAVADAMAVLHLGMRVAPNPLLGAWVAWLMNDAAELPENSDLGFVFPFRRETLAVLDWAMEHSEHWSWSYLLALNLWGRDRGPEAAALLEPIRDAAGYAPFYVSRASLLQQTRQRDPEADLRRAVQLDGTRRMLHIYLIRYLQDEGRWSDALTESSSARRSFNEDFNLDLLHVRSLVNLGRPIEAIEILNTTHVLPSENAGASHLLYEQAHTLAALNAIDAGGFEAARRHLLAALEWPEQLGQGRPYQPEERLVRFLLGRVEQQLGEVSQARQAFQAVVDATGRTGHTAMQLDLLVIPALVALQQQGTIDAVWNDTETEIGQVGLALIGAVENGDDIAEAAAQLAAEHLDLFQDLSGQLILRAMGTG
ncbi:MAG: hypothetical protein JSW51_02765, partial [Gemmatimonadota bacterium]